MKSEKFAGMEGLFLGLIVGVIVAYLLMMRWQKKTIDKRNVEQAVILKDKIRSVCKLISVEGDFAEIYHYEQVTDKFFKLLTGTKKALILIDAKAHVGFDLSKIAIQSDPKQKKMVLTHFPQPELVSVETDFKYYDKKEGWFNPFTAGDLTAINRDAKQYIVDKVPDSGLLDAARQEALKSIQIMEALTQSIGWKLDYSALTLDSKPESAPRIKESQQHP